MFKPLFLSAHLLILFRAENGFPSCPSDDAHQKDSKEDSYVSGNRDGERMNEYKTHLNWARKTCFLAETFGIIPRTV